MSPRSLTIPLALAAFLLPLSAVSAQQPLAHVNEVRQMSSADAARAVPLRIRGTVTALSGWKNSFFLQDSGGGVSVDRTDSAEVHAGDLVEVVGLTGAGLFAPVVQAHEVHVLAGREPLPVARRAAYGDLAGGKLDSQRIEIRGVVHSAAVSSNWGRPVLFLGIDMDGEMVTARVREFSGPNFHTLIDATVRVRGVSGTIFNEKRQFLGARLFVPSLDDVAVEEKGAADPFSVPETPLAQLLQFDLTQKMSRRVRVSGVLTAERAGRILYLQQGGEGIVVRTEQPVSAAIGSRVEAAGFVGGREYSLALHDALVRVGREGALPAAIRVSASRVNEVKDGFAFAPASGLLVQIEGEVIDRTDRQDEQIWILRDGNKTFEAHLQTVSGSGKNSGISAGSRVQVKGVCVVDVSDDREAQSFRVLLRTPQDIEMVRVPIVTTNLLIWFALVMVFVSIGALLRAFRVNRSSVAKQLGLSAAPGRLRDYCHRAARVAGLLDAGLGAVALLGGWMLDIPRLRTIVDGYSAMRPLTAIGLFFAGMALFMDREEGASALRKRLVLICAGATIMVGLLPLIEYCSLRNFHLDGLFVSRRLVAQVPGHMAFLSAINFVILGCGILLSRTRRGFSAAQYLALLAGTFSLFNAIGFLYGIRSFYGLTLDVGPVFATAMAIHTAVGMIVLSAGLMLSRPSWGLMIPVTSSAPGGVMTRRLLPCALIFPAAAGWLRMQGQAHGLYDGTFGLTLFASANIVIFMSLIWRSAGLLNRSDVERSRSEMHLRASEQNFRRLADAMPPIVWTATPDGNLDYYNQRWYDYTGMTFEQSRDWGWKPVLHPDDLDNCVDRWTRCVQTGELYEVEYRFKRAADGEYRWHLGRAEPVWDEQGGIARWFGTCTDIDDFKRAQGAVRLLNETLEERVQQRTGELADTRAKLQGVLDAATELAIIAADVNGVIQIFNTGAERMLQYSASEMEGIRTPLVFHDPAECEQRAIELAEEFGRPMLGHEIFIAKARLGIYESREWTYIRKDGSRLDVSLCITTVRDAAGEIRGYLGTATDITERKRLEQNLRHNNQKLAEQTRRAEEANRTKSDFLATMSHEIRTPMNAILGMADLLWETELDQDQLQYVEVFRRAGGNLLTLINEILDLSKIEGGHLELEQIHFDLEAVVQSAVELMGIKARGKGLALVSRIMPDVESELVGDPARLRQILINLLGNAVKFTDAGEVTLAVQSADGGRPGSIQFSISDTGIGIPPEKLDTIFDDFTQVDASITRRFGGTGLGLGIGKRLVEQMGGEIGVVSSAQGSTFHFKLNFEVARRGSHERYGDRLPDRGAAATEPPHPEPSLAILIAEDSPDNRLLVQAYLKGTPHRLTFVEDGLQALHAFDAASFDLILMDMQMPLMDGLTATRAIRQREKDLALEPTPIVSLSANARPEDVNRSQQAGCNAHLSKPISKARLLGAIETHAMDVNHSAETIWVEMPEGLEEIVPQYLTGQETELQKALGFLASSDYERLSIAGHRLKGTGTSYGFEGISIIGAALETAAQAKDHAASTRNLKALGDYLGRVKVRSLTAQIC